MMDFHEKITTAERIYTDGFVLFKFQVQDMKYETHFETHRSTFHSALNFDTNSQTTKGVVKSSHVYTILNIN
jgi:hypothetical protein